MAVFVDSTCENKHNICANNVKVLKYHSEIWKSRGRAGQTLIQRSVAWALAPPIHRLTHLKAGQQS